MVGDEKKRYLYNYNRKRSIIISWSGCFTRNDTALSQAPFDLRDEFIPSRASGTRAIFKFRRAYNINRFVSKPPFFLAVKYMEYNMYVFVCLLKKLPSYWKTTNGKKVGYLGEILDWTVARPWMLIHRYIQQHAIFSVVPILAIAVAYLYGVYHLKKIKFITYIYVAPLHTLKCICLLFFLYSMLIIGWIWRALLFTMACLHLAIRYKTTNFINLVDNNLCLFLSGWSRTGKWILGKKEWTSKLSLHILHPDWGWEWKHAIVIWRNRRLTERRRIKTQCPCRKTIMVPFRNMKPS